MVDVSTSYTPDDFVVRAGATDDPSTWSTSSPAINVVQGGGAGGTSDRVTFTWSSGQPYKGWVQITVKANSHTNLTTPAIFYLGSSPVGDFDSDFDVDGADFVAWQTNFPTGSGATRAMGDGDGDGEVDGADFVYWQTDFPFNNLLFFVAPVDQYRTTFYSYDALNRNTRVTDPLGYSTSTKYDALSNVTGITDPLGQTTTFEYDSLNRPTRTIDPRGGDHDTETTYDEAGNITSVKDALGYVTAYSYDQLNRLKTESKPNLPTSPVATTHYNARGDVWFRLDLNGRYEVFDYDAFGRSVFQWGYDPSDATSDEFRYAFDADDQVTYGENARGIWGSSPVKLVSSSFNYSSDPLRRLKESNSRIIANSGATPVTSTITRTYLNQTDDLQQLGVSGSGFSPYVVAYGYDAVGRLSSTGNIDSSSGLNYSATFSYNAADQLQSMTRANWNGSSYNKLETIYGYDLDGRIKSLRHEKIESSGALLQNGYQNYYYDAASRLLQREYQKGPYDASQLDRYGYDEADQIVSATHTIGTSSGSAYQDSETYSYDKNGNRTGTTIGAYNRLLVNGSDTNTYDNEGNLKLTNHGGGLFTQYIYDVRNRLVSVKDWSGAVGTGTLTKQVDYVYDAFDRRVAKRVDLDGGSPNFTTETYTYDGDELLLARSGTGAIQHRFLNGPLIDQVLADDNATSASGVRWFLADEQQTVREVIQTNGTSVTEINYNSFGEITGATTPPGTIGLLVGYTGQVYDAETGLNYFKSRYYDANTGRFISEDTIGFGGGDANLYRYTGNSPTNRTDPYGTSWLSEFGKSVNNFVQKNGGWGVWALAAAFVPTFSVGAWSFGVQEVAGGIGLGLTYNYGSGTNTPSGQSAISSDGQSLGVIRAANGGALQSIGSMGGSGGQFGDFYAAGSSSFDMAPMIVWEFRPATSSYTDYSPARRVLELIFQPTEVVQARRQALKASAEMFNRTLQPDDIYSVTTTTPREQEASERHQLVKDLGSKLRTYFGLAGDIQASLMEDVDELLTNRDNLEAAGYSPGEALLTASGKAVGDHVGVTEIWSAIEGRNDAGEQLSWGERLYSFTVGTIKLVGTAYGGLRAGQGLFGKTPSPVTPAPSPTSAPAPTPPPLPRSTPSQGVHYDPHRVPGPNPNNLRRRVVESPTSGEGGVYLKPQGGKVKVGSADDFYDRYGPNDPNGIQVEIPQTRRWPAAPDSEYRWSPRAQRRFDEEYVDRTIPRNSIYRAPRETSPVDQIKWDKYRHIFGYGNVPSNFGL